MINKGKELYNKAYFYLLCRLSWSFMFPLVVNPFPQRLHENGFSLVWILMWITKLGRSENIFPQLEKGHLNG